MEKKRVSLMVCVLAIALIAGVAEAQDIETGLIAHWKLDETSGTTTYDSVGSNDGTFVGDPCWVTGLVDGALNFPGGIHYINCGNDTSLDITGSRSVSAWVKVDNWVDAWDSIVSKGDAEGNFDLLRNRLADAMAFYVAGATAVRGSIPVKDGYWHLAVGVYDNPAGTVSLYIDGVLDVSVSVDPDLVIGVNTANVCINGLHIPEHPEIDEIRHMDGMIDDVRIYNRALTTDDIFVIRSLGYDNLAPKVDAGLFQSTLVNTATQLDATVIDDGKPEPPSLTYAWSKLSGPGVAAFSDTGIEDPTVTFDAVGGYKLQLSVSDGEMDACDVLDVLVRANDDPIAHWTFETGTGTNIVDQSANNSFGTFVGEPNWVSGWVGDWAIQVADDSYVAITADPAADPNLDAMYGAVTVSAWIKVNGWGSVGSWNGIVTKGDGGAGGAGGWALIRVSTSDNLAFYTPDAGYVAGNFNIRDGYWHHVAAVHDGAAMSLYVDGLLDGSAAASAPLNPNTAEVWINGNSEIPGERLFIGEIDDVRIYNYGLDFDGVQALAAMGALIPAVDAGANETFYMQNDSLQLDATVIDDGNPVAAALAWTADPCSTVSFSDETIEDPIVTFTEVGTYVLRLTADDTVAVISDEVTITVENPTCQDVIDDGLLLPSDLSGPEGVPDCRVDIYDFAALSGDWLYCNDPQDPECEFPY